MLTSILLTTFISNIIFVKSATIYVNSTTPLAIVSDKFLGVTLDPWITHNPQWDGLNFSYIVPLARALGPSIIRFGGTYADKTIFVVKPFNGSTYNEFTAEKLDLLWNFANNSGWRLIFDLNQLLRSGSNWNSTNAQEFLNYATSKGYSMDFELGNPDDRWFFNTNLTGKQIAGGYRDLRNLLNSNAMYKDSMIIGPSVAHASNLWILQDFLSNGGGNYINYLTFHHYYFNGNGTTGKDYMNSTIMDSFTIE